MQHIDPRRLRSLVSLLAACALPSGALAGDVSVTVTGTVSIDNYTSGPYNAATVGDTIRVHFDVDTPGTDVVAGQQTEYDIDLSSFEIQINGSAASGAPSAAQVATVEDDNPADGFGFPVTPLTNGDSLRCLFDAGSSFFASNDIEALNGSYDVASASTSDDFAFSGAGGFMRMSVDSLTIVAPQTVHIELTGMVTSNSYAGGPFGGANPGDTALLVFDVASPGVDVAPGQLTNYAIDLASFDLDINGSTGAALGGATNLQIQNDFPAADGFRTSSQLASGHFFSCEFGTGPGFFSSNEIALLAGSYDAGANLTSFNYVIQGQGGMLEIFPDILTIGSAPVGTNYCVSQPNSVGLSARISASGSTLVADNDFSLHASDTPPNRPGLFFYGPNQVQVPLGSGFRCVGGATVRLQPVVFTDAGGVASRSIDLSAPPAAAQLQAGTTWNFQFWHRDGMADTNLTDGLQVMFL